MDLLHYFNKLRETRKVHPLTTNEQTLFYELVFMNSKSKGADFFPCSSKYLITVLGISDRTFQTARRKLMEVGLIYSNAGKTKNASILYSLVREIVTVDESEKEENSNQHDQISNHNDKHSGEVEAKNSSQYDKFSIQCDETSSQHDQISNDHDEIAPHNIVSFSITSKEKINKKERLKNQFAEFVKKYPGTKRNIETEFNYFINKHTDHEEVIPLLLPAVEKYIAWRNQRIYMGIFVPNNPKLKNWLNQRCWENQYERNYEE